MLKLITHPTLPDLAAFVLWIFVLGLIGAGLLWLKRTSGDGPVDEWW